MPENDAVEQARKKAKKHEWTVDRIMQDLDSIDLHDHRFRRIYQGMSDDLAPLLLEAIRGETSIGKLNASFMLLHMGDAEGTIGLVDCLRSDDVELQKKALLYISWLPLKPLDDKATGWTPRPVPLNQAAIILELERFLSDLGHSDRAKAWLAILALRAIQRLTIPSATTIVTPLLQHHDREVQLIVLGWLASRGIDEGGVNLANKILFESGSGIDDDSLVVDALESYCKADNTALAERAALILALYVKQNANAKGATDYQTNSITNVLWRALSGLEKANYSNESSVLEIVFNSAVNDWRRGVALRRLAALEGTIRIPDLISALADKQLRRSAAEGIALIAEPISDHRLLTALIEALSDDARSDVQHKILDALLVVDPELTETFTKIPKKLNPHDVMRLFWVKNKLTPKKVLKKFASAGIIKKPAKSLERKLEQEWHQTYNATALVYELFNASKILVGFDTESSFDPPNYLELLNEFLDICAPVFPFSDVSQEVDQNTNNSTLTFVYRDKVYRTETKYFGDYYDVDAVVNLLNECLESVKHQHRFILLYTGGQTCAVVFVPEIAFRKLARQIRLPLEEDYAAAMNVGVAYENYVRGLISADDL